jgi:hypothetical protein
VISPATMHDPVVTRTSQATRPVGSSLRTASSTASEIWSAILSGWPSVTDSEVKICRFSAIQLPLPCLDMCDAAGGHLTRCSLLFRELDSVGPAMWKTYEKTKDLSVSNAGPGIQSGSRWTDSIENPGTQIAMYSAPPGSGVPYRIHSPLWAITA